MVRLRIWTSSYQLSLRLNQFQAEVLVINPVPAVSTKFVPVSLQKITKKECSMLWLQAVARAKNSTLVIKSQRFTAKLSKIRKCASFFWPESAARGASVNSHTTQARYKRLQISKRPRCAGCSCSLRVLPEDSHSVPDVRTRTTADTRTRRRSLDPE